VYQRALEGRTFHAAARAVELQARLSRIDADAGDGADNGRGTGNRSAG